MEDVVITMEGGKSQYRLEMPTALFNCQLVDTADWLHYKVTPTNIVFYTKTNVNDCERSASLIVQYLNGDTQDITVYQDTLINEYVFNVTADKSELEYTGGYVNVDIEAVGMKQPYIVKCDTGSYTAAPNNSSYTFQFEPTDNAVTHHLIFVGHTNSGDDIIREILVQQKRKVITYTYYTYTGQDSINTLSSMEVHTTTSLPCNYQLDGYDKKCVAIAIPNSMSLTHFSDMFDDHVELFSDASVINFSKISTEGYTIYKYFTAVGNVDSKFTATFS